MLVGMWEEAGETGENPRRHEFEISFVRTLIQSFDNSMNCEFDLTASLSLGISPQVTAILLTKRGRVDRRT